MSANLENSAVATGLGKKTLRGHKQNLMHTRTQEKGAVTPQETDPDLPVSVQESPAEAWVGGGLLQSWGHLRALSVAVCTGENLKEVTIIFITSTIVRPQAKQQGGNTALPINKKLKIY